MNVIEFDSSDERGRSIVEQLTGLANIILDTRLVHY